MKKFIYLLVLPFLFSFVDPKIGGTLTASSSLKLSSKEHLIVEVTLLKNKEAIAKNIVKNVIFPQAFVVTPKHAIPGKQAMMEGKLSIQIILVDSKQNKKFTTSKLFENIPLGTKDLSIELDKDLN